MREQHTPHTIGEVLQLSQPYLTQRGVTRPRYVTEVVVAHLLGLDRLQLYLHTERPLEPDELRRCSEAIRRLGKREPWQHICAEVPFYNCKIAVDNTVLIPRQETELLVDHIIRQIQKYNCPLTIWDICCGSGCIGIAIKKRLPKHDVVLSDICPKALAVARDNSKRNSVQVDLRQGDLLEPFQGERADLIICNPPYVTEQELSNLEPEVRLYEPHLALAGGPDGLSFYRRLAQEVTPHMKPESQLWLEMGGTQGKALSALFPTGQVVQDWGGHDRFFFLENSPVS